MEILVEASCIQCDENFKTIIEVRENFYVDSLRCSECGSEAFIYGLLDEHVQRLNVVFEG